MVIFKVNLSRVLNGWKLVTVCTVSYGTIPYDIGWKRRASGHLYGSLSNHAFIIGVSTGKYLYAVVVAKKCASFESASRLKKYPRVDGCQWNYVGRIKSCAT